jgi:uncharacterized membrane protein
MTAIFVFIVFASSCAVIAGLERILGRPIPQLRFSRPVRRNRIFAAVPICMCLVFLSLFIVLLRTRTCSHCERPYGWQTPGWILEAFVLSVGFSGAIGWVIFAVLGIVDYAFHLVSRRFLN